MTRVTLRFMFQRTIYTWILLMLLAVIDVGPAFAEFIKTAVNVYQSSDRRLKVIVSQQQPGLFISYIDEGIELQEFDPSSLTDDNALHAFIAYDPSTRRYATLQLGRRGYRIKGSAIVKLGNARITIDNNNPYLSLVQEAGSESHFSPSILSFQGITEVVNAVGHGPVALLEANQFNEYKGLIVPYNLTLAGLELNKAPFTADSIGLALESKNPCLAGNAILLDQRDLKEADKADSNEEKRRLLSAAVRGSRRNPPLNKLIRLRTTQDSVIALDYENARLKVIKELSNSEGGKKICVIEDHTVIQ